MGKLEVESEEVHIILNLLMAVEEKQEMAQVGGANTGQSRKRLSGATKLMLGQWFPFHQDNGLNHCENYNLTV